MECTYYCRNIDFLKMACVQNIRKDYNFGMLSKSYLAMGESRCMSKCSRAGAVRAKKIIPRHGRVKTHVNMLSCRRRVLF